MEDILETSVQDISYKVEKFKLDFKLGNIKLLDIMKYEPIDISDQATYYLNDELFIRFHKEKNAYMNF